MREQLTGEDPATKNGDKEPAMLSSSPNRTIRLLRGLPRGLTMIELAVAFVIVGAFVFLFRAQAADVSQARAADDLAAQARLDSIANAIHNAMKPGFSVADLTIEDLSAYTTAPMTRGTIPVDDEGVPLRRYVSIDFGEGLAIEGGEITGGSQEGYFGIATLGRDGSCWLLRGKIGLTGQADLSPQTAYHSYLDLGDQSELLEDGTLLTGSALAAQTCTGELALNTLGGGSSWQSFTLIDSLIE